MANIKLLKEEVFRKIAAGEVIERPLSVVKELVENSLDAHASEIRIELQKGGKELVSVQDNGEGFAACEVELAFQPHSTSKLTELVDLDRLSTLGFRGEALPSILEVAQIIVQSSDNQDGRGVRLVFQDGVLAERREIAFARGTSLEVQCLFHNFPVRRKFLKSDTAELQQVVQFLEQAALANPRVSFELVHNGRSLFNYAAVHTLSERIYQVFGGDFFAGLQEMNLERPPLLVRGFISRPGHGIPAKNRQYFVVNGRPVREKTLVAAVNGSTQPFLEKGKHPAVILFLDLPGSEVDVNIHPMKLEIRFRDSSAIYSLVRRAIENAFSPGGIATAPEIDRHHIFQKSAAAFDELQRPLLDPTSAAAQDSFQVLGQYRNSYIVVEKEGELLVVDQHNARERVLFERLARQHREGEVASAQTLFPILAELTPAEKNSLSEERLAQLKKAGFEVVDLGGLTIEIRTYPQLLDEKNVREVLIGILDFPPEEWSASDKILAGIACKAAVKVNHALGIDAMQQIVRDLFACSNPHLCPHQRPIFATFSLPDIEKLLKRR